MKRRGPRLQRVAQAASLGAFLWLLWAWGVPDAGAPAPGVQPVFLWLDPLAALGTWIAGRAWVPAFAWGFWVLALTVLAGRWFCGHVCPLGATVDAADALGRKKRGGGPRHADAKAKGGEDGGPRHASAALAPGWRRPKYLVLAGILAAAALGVSLVFTAAPLSLATRFYGLVVLPLAGHGAEAALRAGRPAIDALDWTALLHAQVRAPRYATMLFTALFVGGILLLGRIAPRLWCRALCPAGALMALAAFAPPLRRRVSEDCIQCGTCRKSCPMDAIGEDARVTATRECITCLRCVRVCPVDAVHFRLGGGEREGRAFLPARRAVLNAGLAGAGVAALAHAGLTPARPTDAQGLVASDALVRPPGTLPEADFLARCIRCGACVAACPTNTLQPTWAAAGPWGVFSPVAEARRGPCAPDCARCGQACPTGAIRPLPLAEKTWAKMGTAVVRREKCLAWEQGKSCLVCDETCPYGAVRLRRVPESPVGVPFVDEDRCAGCGACEHFCPARNEAAIVITPMNALRLGKGSFEEAGRGRGLDIRRKPVKAYPGAEQGGTDTLPGFDPAPGAAPPGTGAPAPQAPPAGAPAPEAPAPATPAAPAPPPGFDPAQGS